MDTNLYGDSIEGTHIVFHDRPRGESEIVITLAKPSFGKVSASLDLDDVDRLLAVVEHAVDPELDLAEFFEDVYGVSKTQAARAAHAFRVSAPSLAEIVYGT